MNRDRTREVVDKLAIPVVASNGHGIEIHRTMPLVTDAQIRALREKLFKGPADARQLLGLVDCHDALGRSHRNREARVRCAEEIGNLRVERWRLYTGGGIAGNSDKVWLSPIARPYAYAVRGPYWNKTQLAKALRAWRRGG